jgi:hypothetical protein
MDVAQSSRALDHHGIRFPLLNQPQSTNTRVEFDPVTIENEGQWS